MTAKSPSPQSISALLKRAGFERSESGTTRVRGWHTHSYGFTVEGYGKGHVRVHHTSGRFHPSDEDKAASRQLEDRYAEAIEAAGYATHRDEWGNLHVTAKTED